ASVVGVLEPGEVAACGPRSPRDRKWHPAEGLEDVDDWGEPPRLDVISKFWFQTRQPFGVVSARAHLFLRTRSAALGWDRPCAAPPEVGRVPGGLTGITDSVPQEKCFEPKLGGLQSTDDLFMGSAQVPHCILNLGHINRRAIPRAHQAGQVE